MALTDVVTGETARWTNQWLELKAEVIDTNLCTGCAGCVVSCPHDVIGYNPESGGYKPFHPEDDLGPDDCIPGQQGCTSCKRACPRYRSWEPESDDHLFARYRTHPETPDLYPAHLLTQAPPQHEHKLV